MIATSPAEACLLTLLWSSSDGEHESLEDFDPSPSLVDRVADDWEIFRHTLELWGFDPEVCRRTAFSDNRDPWDYVAHDFILTRNGHGAGFLDGDWLNPWGEKISKLIRSSFGELEIYLGDDGFLYPF